MNRLAITLLLAAFSGSAGADWVYVHGWEDKTDYADPNTIFRSGSIVRMWSLIDFNTAQKVGNDEAFLSTVSQMEYDCQDERFRILYDSFYAKHMGAGKAIHSESRTSVWLPFISNHSADYLRKFACGKE